SRQSWLDLNSPMCGTLSFLILYYLGTTGCSDSTGTLFIGMAVLRTPLLLSLELRQFLRRTRFHETERCMTSETHGSCCSRSHGSA
ncbi:unnamed protein product, partial [Mycena citricolor]